MTDLLQEIMDDVRADRASDLWRKYGKWVIGTALSIVVVTAVSVYSNHRQREEFMQQTALYLQASDSLAKGEAEQTLQMLEKIAVPSRSGYEGVVLLKKFQAQSALGKKEDAQKTLLELSKHGDVYGDIGKIMQVDGVVGGDKTTALLFTRSEWAAWEAFRKGDIAKASAQFSTLAKMPDVPATMHDRALMMAVYLQNKAGVAHE